jgi:hypothetical protein
LQKNEGKESIEYDYPGVNNRLNGCSFFLEVDEKIDDHTHHSFTSFHGLFEAVNASF